MKRIDVNPYIVVDPKICHGKPTFKGTRIMVWQILEMLESSATDRDIHRAFPRINKKHIQAALSYACDLTKGESLVFLKA